MGLLPSATKFTGEMRACDSRRQQLHRHDAAPKHCHAASTVADTHFHARRRAALSRSDSWNSDRTCTIMSFIIRRVMCSCHSLARIHGQRVVRDVSADTEKHTERCGKQLREGEGVCACVRVQID